LNVAGIREQLNYLFPEFPAMAGKRMFIQSEAMAGKIKEFFIGQGFCILCANWFTSSSAMMMV